MTKKEKNNDAMDKLFSGLTMPASSPSSQTEEQCDQGTVSDNSISPRQKKYKEENERVCTIMEYEDIYKLRFIASKENLSIRNVFGAAAKMLIKKYESTNGVIPVKKRRPKKGDISKIFDV